MSRMLREILPCSQWAFYSSGGSTQHGRDMGRAMAEQKYDCDERGYPVDPDHPWNKPSPPNDRRASLARRFARRMTALQRAWEIGGNPLAIAEAVKLCHEFQQPPWQWIAEAVSGFVDDRITEAEKRRLRETAKHLTRYDLVQELVERREEFMENKDDRASTWEKRYA